MKNFPTPEKTNLFACASVTTFACKDWHEFHEIHEFVIKRKTNKMKGNQI